MKARLFDVDSYQPAGMRLIRERDTAGIDSSVPLHLIDIGRARGVKSRQEQAYLQFAGQRIGGPSRTSAKPRSHGASCRRNPGIGVPKIRPEQELSPNAITIKTLSRRSCIVST